MKTIEPFQIEGLSLLVLIILISISSSAQTFKSVKIGDQVWMAENLNVSKFRNGDSIPQCKTAEQWERAGEDQQPAWCYYLNDPSNASKFGRLYNWYAVNDPRVLAPQGWHIPSDKEWTQLNNSLRPNTCLKLKSTNGWNSFLDSTQTLVSGNGTDLSGFKGLPGGWRTRTGSFSSKGVKGIGGPPLLARLQVPGYVSCISTLSMSIDTSIPMWLDFQFGA